MKYLRRFYDWLWQGINLGMQIAALLALLMFLLFAPTKITVPGFVAGLIHITFARGLVAMYRDIRNQ